MRPTLLRLNSLFRPLLALIPLLLLGLRAAAQTPTYSYSTGTTSNAFPLGSTTSNMCQWLLLPGDFSPTPPTSGVMITRVYVQAGNSRTSSSTITNLTIKLNTNSALTVLTSGPWNTGLTTVYNPATTTISAWTAGDWIPFNLPTPIFYNGTGGIIIEMSQTAYTGAFNVRQGSGTGNRRMYGNVNNANSTAAGTNRLNFGFDAVPAACSGQPANPTITSAAMSPASPVCSGSTTIVRGGNPNLGTGITLRWQQASAAAGPWSNTTGGSGGTTLNYTTPALTADRYYRLSVTCTHSNLTSYSPAYHVRVGAPQPGVMAGSSSFCPGDSVTYTVPNTTGTTYTWTLPSGWGGASTTNSIRVRPGTAAGSVSVTARSACGTSVARSSAVVRGFAPARPDSIQGRQYVCGNTNQVYSVNAVPGATSYAWTLPTGWAGVPGARSISTTSAQTSGTITLNAVNGCGSSPARVMPVTVISSLAHPGPIAGRDTACSGSLQQYSIAPVNGATSYTWTLPSGWSGTTSGTSIQAFPGTVTDSIRVRADVSCAVSPVSARRIHAIPTVTPAVSLMAPAGLLCSGTPMRFTANSLHPGGVPLYTWRVNGSVMAGSGNTFTTASLNSGDTLTVSLRSTAACATDTVVQSSKYVVAVTQSVTPGISINTTPPTAICAGSEMRFTTSINNGGSAPEYQWYINGSALNGETGTTFTTSTLNDQDTVTVTLESNARCASDSLSVSNKIGVHVVDSLVPEVSINVSPSDVMRPGDELTFEATGIGGGETPDFQWQRNGVHIPFATERVFTSRDLVPGDHIRVRMLSHLSCAISPVVFSTAIDLKDGALSVAGTSGAGGLRIYPNPNGGAFRIQGPVVNAGSSARVEIFNALGQLSARIELRGAGGAIDSELRMPQTAASGRYQLRLLLRDRNGVETAGGTAAFVLQR